MKDSKQKRKHLQIMNRVEAMEKLASNKKTVIYGEQGNNLLANIEIFKTVMGS